VLCDDGLRRASRKQSHLPRLHVFHGTLQPERVIGLALHHEHEAPIGGGEAHWKQAELGALISWHERPDLLLWHLNLHIDLHLAELVCIELVRESPRRGRAQTTCLV